MITQEQFALAINEVNLLLAQMHEVERLREQIRKAETSANGRQKPRRKRTTQSLASGEAGR
jgi:hypothetical protein